MKNNIYYLVECSRSQLCSYRGSVLLITAAVMVCIAFASLESLFGIEGGTANRFVVGSILLVLFLFLLAEPVGRIVFEFPKRYNSILKLLYGERSKNRNIISDNLLSRLAYIDELTGADNRHSFNIALEEYFSNREIMDGTVGLVLFDIDKFKHINDAYGHEAGNAVLCELASVVLAQLNEKDHFARMGGDEFGILLARVTDANVVEVVENILTSIRTKTFKHLGSSYSITISMGLVYFNKSTESINEILNEADSACYAAKKAGGDRIKVGVANTNNLDSMKSKRAG